jgi:imidazole glycerol-phosphate synthase subunit HisF
MLPNKNPYKKGGMFEGASHLLFEKAKQLRNKMTGTEEILWMHLRNGINGFKFRGQHPIGNYIVDLFCFKAKLVIEIDGSIHNNDEIKEKDINKQRESESLGYTVIRFTNIEIHQQVETVLNKISDLLNNIIKTKTPKYGV